MERVDLRRRAVAQAVRGQVGSGRHGLLRAGAGGGQALEGRLRRAGPMRPIRPVSSLLAQTTLPYFRVQRSIRE